MGTFTNRLPWLLLSAAFAVAACAPPTGAPAGTASASTTPAASADVSAAPSAAVPSAVASGATTPSGAPSAAAPSAGPSASPAMTYETGILKGTIYDEAAELVPDGTLVTITSMDQTKPYKATVTTTQGLYVANGVPLNTQVEVTATRPGWTTRTQVGVVRPYDPRFETTNIFNFGGKVTIGDRRGLSYFLSDYPEITAVTPTDQDSSLPRDEIRFELKVSEKLSGENQRRLAAAFLIIPNNDEAIGEEMVGSLLEDDDEELRGLRIVDPDDDATSAEPTFPYAFRQNAGFLNGAETSEFAWSEDGLTATFTLKAPLKTGRTDQGEYAFMLIQRDDDPIRDDDENALGTDEEGKFGETLLGDVIYNAIAEPAVNITEGFDDAEERWADTHLSFTRFSVEEDDEAPKLEKVIARRNFVDDEGEGVERIEMTFSEPMAAFPRITSKGLLSLDNYVISAAVTEAELNSRDIKDDGSAVEIGTALDGEDVRDLIEGSNGASVDSNRAEAGNFRVSLSVRDPKVVILELPAGSLPLDADFIKIVAGSDGEDGDTIGDPAGNPIAAGDRAQIGPIF